ncbi:unnamed protein product [Polarella glacialis]|uniref:Rab-GAP TBC domain-containing protein n=1 Tax=Polarella glacialis TaxID=89957 RepID=A0A813GC23_POLGL|nr:unnamed protein product [Polarella glacialis]
MSGSIAGAGGYPRGLPAGQGYSDDGHASQLQALSRFECWRRVLLGKVGGPSSESPLAAAEPRRGSHQNFSSWRIELTETNQRVIHADCERTRADTEYFRRPDVRRKMEEMLTCWCQQQKARYKQGLNEVLAPFLHLQTEEPPQAQGGRAKPPSDDEVFALFNVFLVRFAPFFDSDDFVPLQCAFVFFRRLLLYHRPDLHNLLVERGVSPDMFCMPWFLTLFASKTPMRLTLQLWDRHLERGEPPFFMFLATAVLLNSEQAVMGSERSQLPEILTSIGISTREELESLWSAAEGLYIRTPATFTARLRRNVLRVGATKPAAGRESGRAGSEADATETDSHALLERLEQERCFFVLPEEVVGHCYPPKAGEARKPWQPSPVCPWRLLLLDVRPMSDFEAARLPAAIHFDPFGPSGPSSAAPPGQGAWAAGRRLLQWAGESQSQLEPTQVFESLKETLGEGWVCDREAHICLLGAAEDSALVRSLYQVLTEDLTLRHVSVASGGFEAVVSCAQKQGFEIICQNELDRQPSAAPSTAAAAAAGGAAAAAAAAAEGAASKFSSAWSSLKRVAAGASGAAGGADSCAESSTASHADIAGHTKRATSSTAPAESVESTGVTASATPTGPPALRDRPGNWPSDFDLKLLPRIRRASSKKEFLQEGVETWVCVAVVVKRHPSQCDVPGQTDKAASGIAGVAAWPWEGCKSILSLGSGRIVCSTEEEPATVLGEFEVSHVLKVTAKKQAPDVLIFYFREDAATGGSLQEPSMVLHFTEGSEQVGRFIKALRGSHSVPPSGSGSSKAERPLDPPSVAAAAAAVAVAVAAVDEDREVKERHLQDAATLAEGDLQAELATPSALPVRQGAVSQVKGLEREGKDSPERDEVKKEMDRSSHVTTEVEDVHTVKEDQGRHEEEEEEVNDLQLNDGHLEEDKCLNEVDEEEQEDLHNDASHHEQGKLKQELEGKDAASRWQMQGTALWKRGSGPEGEQEATTGCRAQLDEAAGADEEQQQPQ